MRECRKTADHMDNFRDVLPSTEAMNSLSTLWESNPLKMRIILRVLANVRSHHSDICGSHRLLFPAVGEPNSRNLSKQEEFSINFAFLAAVTAAAWTLYFLLQTSNFIFLIKDKLHTGL